MLSDVSNSWRLMKATEIFCVVRKSNMLLRYKCVIIIIIIIIDMDMSYTRVLHIKVAYLVPHK
jgi:hypothetical protein